MPWIPCPEGFIAEDVIRFLDPVWYDGRRRNMPKKMGDLLVTAEIIEYGPKVKLRVLDCSIATDRSIRLVHPLKKGEVIERDVAKMVQWGKPERRRWHDESARAAVVKV